MKLTFFEWIKQCFHVKDLKYKNSKALTWKSIIMVTWRNPSSLLYFVFFLSACCLFFVFYYTMYKDPIQIKKWLSDNIYLFCILMGILFYVLEQDITFSLSFNYLCIPITFNNPLKACLSNKKCLIYNSYTLDKNQLPIIFCLDLG